MADVEVEEERQRGGCCFRLGASFLGYLLAHGVLLLFLLSEKRSERYLFAIY